MNQFSGSWKIVHPEKQSGGPRGDSTVHAFRDDVQAVVESKANGNGPKRNANQRVIDMLRNGDMIVVDLYGKEEDGTYVGDNLATAIRCFTHTGMVVDGAIRDLEGIRRSGCRCTYAALIPTPIAKQHADRA